MNFQELKAKYRYEDVYVVKSELVARLGLQEGFNSYSSRISNTICNNGFFIRRYNAEHNPKFKQIIPYVVIKHGNSLFAIQRLKSASSEERLYGNISIGHAGHINRIDQIQIGNLFSNCVIRELSEELVIYNNIKPQARYCGILNDNSNDVSRDHLGLVVLINVSKPTIQVRDTEKALGYWATLEELNKISTRMEPWSQLVLDELLARSLEQGDLTPTPPL